MLTPSPLQKAMTGIRCIGRRPGTSRRRAILTSTLVVVPLAVVAGTALAAGGSSETSASAMADKASQIYMKVTNNTGETLVAGLYDHGGDGVHWMDRPHTMAPGESETFSVYAAGGPSIWADFVGATSGNSWHLTGSVPAIGYNSWGATSSQPGYSADIVGADGYTPEFQYNLHWGNTLAYTGTPQTITVPDGVTKINFAADGGPGGDPFVLDSTMFSTYVAPRPLGTHIAGTLNVTPGEKLTLAVGGRGNNVYMESRSYVGGWSLDGYRGGAGGEFSDHVGGGGGASVIQDGSGQPIVISGGGGGSYGNSDPDLDNPTKLKHMYGWGGRGDQNGGPGDAVTTGTQINAGELRFIAGTRGGVGEDATPGSGGGGGGGWVGGGHGSDHNTGGGGGMSWYDTGKVIVDHTSPQPSVPKDRTSQTGQISFSVAG